MDEARQSEVLLGDVQMRGRCIAESRRKAALVGDDQRGAGDGCGAQGDEPGRRPREAVAPQNRGTSQA